MPNNMRAGLIVIEAWFRGYGGSPGLGGVRIAGLYTLAGLLDYEDTILFIPCPGGTLLCMEGKLRKVPSGHGTKSSILYLHSLGVRSMMIVRPMIIRLMMVVRLSGHPLIRDSLSSP